MLRGVCEKDKKWRGEHGGKGGGMDWKKRKERCEQEEKGSGGSVSVRKKEKKGGGWSGWKGKGGWGERKGKGELSFSYVNYYFYKATR